MRRLAALAAVVFATALIVRAQQEPAPTFRATVDLVDVDVSVLDENRLPILGLTAADFEVYENGRRRPIVSFAAVDLPNREMPSARWMNEVSADVATNEVRDAGRLVTIVIDQSIGVADVPVVRELAIGAIDQLRPGDLAAVLYTAFGVPQGFTADRRALVAAVDQPFRVLAGDDVLTRSECRCGVCALQTITHVAESLEEVRQRRRVLIYIGSELRSFSTGACSLVLEPARTRALRALESSNVTVHVFDPTGIETLSSQASSAAPTSRQALAASLARRNNLMLLPDHTGGRAVFGNAPAMRVTDVLRESSSYYVLGIEPANPESRRRFNDIDVKVRGRHAVVQARQGYTVTDTAARSRRLPLNAAVPEGLRSAISSLWPASTLALDMTAVPLAMPGLRSATVAVTLRARRSLAADEVARLTAYGLNRPREIDILLGAFDRNGRGLAHVRQTTQAVLGTLDETRVDYETTARLNLEPGRYELRAAVSDGVLGDAGSVYGYVEVPDFVEEPYTLSGIFFDVDPAGRTIPGSSLADLIPLRPTTRRDFARTDRVTAFVREHQGLTHDVIPGYLTAQIFDETDRRVFRHELRLLPEQLGANRAVDISFDLPLESLTPGTYLLSVDARHGNATVRRDAIFRVR